MAGRLLTVVRYTLFHSVIKANSWRNGRRWCCVRATVLSLTRGLETELGLLAAVKCSQTSLTRVESVVTSKQSTKKDYCSANGFC